MLRITPLNPEYKIIGNQMVKMLTSYEATMEKYELCFSILHYSVNIIQFCIYTVNLTGHFKEYQVAAQHIGFAPADGKAGVPVGDADANKWYRFLSRKNRIEAK